MQSMKAELIQPSKTAIILSHNSYIKKCYEYNNSNNFKNHFNYCVFHMLYPPYVRIHTSYNTI